MSTASQYFNKNFQGSEAEFIEIRGKVSTGVSCISDKELKKKAQEVKLYLKNKGIKFNKEYTYTQRNRVNNENSTGNINITINENKGLDFWDYLLLSHIFSGRQQPIIINNSHSSIPRAKEENSQDKTNKMLFLIALCVITHLMVCAIHHLYFKKEAENPDQSIDYLANRQLAIAVFQLVFGAASFVVAGMSISQSEVFFPFLINTFICLGSSCIFYCKRDKTIENEVNPYTKLVGLIFQEQSPAPSAPPSYERQSKY